MILSKELVDQGILQSNSTRSITDQTQPKEVVSNATFPWLLTVCIKNDKKYIKRDITWFSPKISIIKESCSLTAWKGNLTTSDQTTAFSNAAFTWRPTLCKITKIPLDSFQIYWWSKNTAIWLAESILEPDFFQTCAFWRITKNSFRNHFWVKNEIWMD